MECWFFPKTLETIRSSTNGQIKVIRHFGRVSVWIGGFQQSGPLVEKLWGKALDVIARSEETKQSSKNVLILGLGCGSAIKPLIQKFPHAQITGIEIDPTMISLGKKYFELDKYKNLKIIISSAKEYLRKTKKKFNLVLIDIYRGRKIIALENLPKIMSKDGIIILNSLNNQSQKLDGFIEVKEIKITKENSLIFYNRRDDYSGLTSRS